MWRELSIQRLRTKYLSPSALSYDLTEKAFERKRGASVLWPITLLTGLFPASSVNNSCCVFVFVCLSSLILCWHLAGFSTLHLLGFIFSALLPDNGVKVQVYM